MCGRYALALRPSQIRQYFEDEGMAVSEAPEDDGDDSPRQSYNFAPGYHGLVYRANISDSDAGPRDHQLATSKLDTSIEEKPAITPTVYKLQTMKWGLIPSWTKRATNYGSLMKTINCRDDSLSSPGGMWTTMKNRKRCIVVAEGFFEWLKTGPKDKLPHFVKRADGGLMCFAGLWDCVQYDGSDEKHYTYTIITTDSNSQLRFLHDRMPVILEPGSESLRTWLDPTQDHWSRELQSLLRPFDGAVEVYPVSKEVGKVGNDSPNFVIPLYSKQNKSNIANFFANPSQTKDNSKDLSSGDKKERKVNEDEVATDGLPIDCGRSQKTSPIQRKRPSEDSEASEPVKKRSSATTKPTPVDSKRISATRNQFKTPPRSKVPPGSQRITQFFGNSA